MPTHRTGMGREAHPDVQEVSGSPSGGPGGVGRPTQRFGRGREAHPKVWVGHKAQPEVREGTGCPPVS